MATKTKQKKAFTVQGIIYDAFNAPMPNVLVRAFDLDLRSEEKLGKVVTDKNGKYLIKYRASKFSRAEKKQADIFIVVSKTGRGAKEMGRSAVHFNVTSDFTIDYKIDGTRYIGLSEFDTLVNTIQPLLEGQRIKIADLKADEKVDDFSFLSKETGIDASILSLLSIAFKHNETTKNNLPPDIFYGLFRLQYPTKLNTLLLIQSKSISAGIKEAIKSNIISKKWEKEIPEIIKGFNTLSSRLIIESKDEDKAGFQTLIKTVLTTKELREHFIDTHLSTEANPEDFWKELAKKPGFTAKSITDTQNVLKLNLLTNQPLVAAELYKLQEGDSDLKETRDYTKLNTSDFEKSIKSSGIKTFPQGIKGETKKEKIANYAEVLENQLRELFPSDAFKHRMTQDQDSPFGGAKTDLKTFLSENQDFDLNTTKLERLFETSDFSGVRNKELTKKELKKINRIYKIGTNYENTRAILKAGLGSAFDIVQVPKAEFVNTISTSGGVTKATAIKLHNDAVLLDNRTTAMATKLKTESDIAMNVMSDATNLSPDLQSLFGDSNLCDCEHCQSVYSPSAYFVDILNYMKNEVPDAIEEILKRRPDLEHILLTCANTNTVLPYIDLVNEVLENQIANPNVPIEPTRVPQTNNTSEELAAFPEHVITEVYTDILNEAFSSFQLPLDLSLEEARIYTEKLNCKRHELMELFYGKKGSHKYNDVAIATEYLGLSVHELNVINGRNTTAIANLPTNQVSEFLERTELTYMDLLQLLECYFINPVLPNDPPVRTIKIVAKDNVPIDEQATCDINKLELNGLDDTTTKQIIRFIRLWKKLDWDILDLDKTFTALGINKGNFDDSADDINSKLIIPLSHISRIKYSYNSTIPEILSLWSDLPSEIYIDHTKTERPIMMSFYDSLFKNKKISNPLDEDMANPKSFPNTETLESKSSIITAAYNISENDFDLLNQAVINQIPIVDGTLDLGNLSALYRYKALSKMLHLSIEEFLLLIEMSGIIPFGGSENTINTFLFIENFHLIQSTNFSLLELSDLLKLNPTNELQLDPNVIVDVLASLREGLLKIDIQFPEAANDQIEADNKLVAQNALITDSLSTAFNAESKIISVMLNGMVKFTADDTKAAFFPFIENEETIASINVNDEVEWTNPDLVNTYIVLYETWKRLELLMNKFSLTAEEFIYFQSNEVKLELKGIWNLPTTNFEQFPAFENLFNLLQFKNKLIQPTEDWYLLFDDSNSETDFLAKLKSLTNIEITDLVSIASGANLNITFPADYLNGEHLVNLIDCDNKVTLLGSTVENIAALTNPDPDNLTALIAKNILKARYEDKEWLEIIEPISNQLRAKKRNALVSYLLTATETESFRTDNSISDSNDLYAHFLIDTEMAPCMMTSRIKQAISSTQLFIDRCLMGLENGISVDTDFANQWIEWRKVYRIWGANREVFIHPENWINSELRDDKSPFFIELEAKLTQNEVTDDIAKDALLEYLEKLDAVANLQIIGFFEESFRRVTHVLGRTKNIPHQYFYRKREKSIWTAWEKVELDIQGDHVLLVVWNNRLKVFWSEFTEKQKENLEGTSPVRQSNGKFDSDKPEKYLEMKLSWSEYKNDRWISKQISEQPLELDANLGITVSNKRLVFLNSQIIGDKLSIKVLGPTHICDPESVLRVMARIINPANTDNLGGIGNFDPGQPDDDGENEDECIDSNSLSLIGRFDFNNCNNSPEVVYPNGGKVNKISGTLFQSPFLKENRDNALDVYQNGSGMFQSIVDNKPKVTIFNKTPGTFHLLANHHKTGTSKTTFFYNNDKSTFYAQSLQRLEQRVVDADLSNTKLLFLRNFNEPTPIGTFNTNVGLASFAISEHFIPNNSPDVLEQPQPESPPSSSDIFLNKKTYTFQTFYHPFVCKYIETLNTEGIDALYNENLQNDFETLFTTLKYNPDTSNVKTPYPVEEVDFSLKATYSIYNWELFFHIPLLIASRLSLNLKFREAQQWYHYVFDPTKSSDLDLEMNAGVKRFWITKPFKEQIDKHSLSIEDLINEEENTGELSRQLRNWEENPFNPHAIARFRNTAYMRSTVMKYIENLMAWGDQLFRRDSIESINEATLLYVLAANILGKQPEKIPARAKPVDSTFNTIEEVLNPFSTAKVAIEAFLSPSGINELITNAPITMPLFCLPKNTKLLGYWDTVADKLFKIRNCMNIEGVVRQLPTFEPRIDPALLIRARAAGLDLNSILNEINATLPNYRFQIILQKANELCNDVKSLGNQLLSTLEKKDAEELSLLRSVHEIKLLALMRDIKKRQVGEAKENLNALKDSKKVIEERKNYYSSRPLKNHKESSYLKSLNDAIYYQTAQGANEVIASVLFGVPNVNIGAWSWGTTSGGEHLAGISKSIGASLGAISNYILTQGNISSVEGGYQRREDDWKFQAKTAELELKQIEKQILAAEIRQVIAEKDLGNHEVQMEQSKKVDDYMRDKFTNAELYNHMLTQVSGIYFQTYQMAYDFAKKAEKCYQFELGITDSNLIKFGHWDSLKKGLLSGEKLQFDLRRLETSFFENNIREFEIERHISLRRLDPQKLLELKATGKLEGVTIPEWLFDLDCPGHYKRRIKTIGLSIPCITGPYTSVNCKLALASSDIRIVSSIIDNEQNIQKTNSNINSIVTSSAQNDNGMFEGNLRDERYLPFEGAGIANSVWNMELPKMKQFDYNSINDVILHVSYTALDGGETFKNEVIVDYESKLNEASENNMYRLLSLEHDFPNEWHTFITEDNTDFVAELKDEHFPYFAQSNKQIESKELFQINANGELTPVDKLLVSSEMEIKVDTSLAKELPTFVIVEYSINL